MSATIARPQPGPAPAGAAPSSEEAPVASPAESPPAAPAAAPAPRPNRVPLVVLGLAALAGLAFGVQRWQWGRTHVSSDDAQVEGHVVPALSKVGGYVLRVPVEENQHVNAGDLLVQLDDREYRAKLAQADADLQVALAATSTRGRTGATEAQLAGARASVAQAEANALKARQDVERYRKLAANSIISRQQLDAAVAASSAADAGLDAARKNVLAAEAAVQGAGGRVAAARAARDQAALNVDYTRIVAPVSGVVSRKTVELGQLVQAGQTTMSVVPLNDVWVVANLKETEVRNVAPGDRAGIRVDAYPGRTFRGHVESLSPATGARFSLLPPDNATGNFTKVVQRIPVRIRVDGPEDPQHPLRPGMSVVATITTR